ncbi:MAG TPA: type I restriction endonuclease subunit R [Deinococcales bacterium]|nr:type I restriction endonuclease subunit R [Deinococcales bacterium]
MGGVFLESVVEAAALEVLGSLGWHVLPGPRLAPGGDAPERESFSDVVLAGRLRRALERLNPGLPQSALDEAFRKLTRLEGPDLVGRNRAFHEMLSRGVSVEVPVPGQGVRGLLVRVVDFEHAGTNDLLAVNQVVVKGGAGPQAVSRRLDVVLFLNGLPVGVLELKNAADENATVRQAFQQLQTYKAELPGLFDFNEVLVASDGLDARVGSLTAPWERFMPWRAVEGRGELGLAGGPLEGLLQGLFEPSRFVGFLRSFVAFPSDGAKVSKVIGAYHQVHAALSALEATARASSLGGDRRGGVVWHTQGSGKSLTMAFYAGCLVRDTRLGNPTLVVLTDRNDLDDQLFGTFSRCSALLGQEPARAESRAELRRLLSVRAGGVVFATIQKFAPDAGDEAHPLLTDRENVVVIADEAHRSQYGFAGKVKEAEDGAFLGYGFAKYLRDALPNATFVGFTGTPVALDDRNTREVFGEYVSVYDIARAVEDGATVPIYYESRLAELALPEDAKPRVDAEFEEVAEDAEETAREAAKRKWAQLEAMVGTPQRLALVAADISQHFAARCEVLDGKAMIVCMSRRIAVALFEELAKLHPDWVSDDDTQGALKVVMTGSASDPLNYQPHLRSKGRLEALAGRFKNPDDPFRVVIVRDMWLTGFDAPSLSTLYLDKPMRGHTLMQAIARVNRVFKDKPGGLVVDYLGLADELRAAMATYTAGGGQGRPTLDQGEAARLVLEKLDVLRAMLHGVDRAPFLTGTPMERMRALVNAREELLSREREEETGEGLEPLTKRFAKTVAALTQAFALAVPDERALAVREEVAYWQAVQAGLAKLRGPSGGAGGAWGSEGLDHAVAQIVSRAIAPGEVIDVFTAAGLPKPDISILSDEFLAEVLGLPQRNLAFELLQRLLKGEVKDRERKNVVEARRFSELLEAAVRDYANRALTSQQVIQALVDLAREMRAAAGRGESLGLTDDELAFYDALAENDSAKTVLGDAQLRVIAQELVRLVKQNVSVDWTERENVKARLRSLVRRTLKRYGYPPDQAETATRLVLEQAQAAAREWAA